MSATRGKIPDLTLETLCRTFFKQAAGYGFTHVDYVKFVNLLLDMAMGSGAHGPRGEPRAGSPPAGGDAAASAKVADLPLEGARVVVRRFHAERDMPLFGRWLADTWGKYFLLSRTTCRALDFDEVVNSGTSVIGVITLPDTTPIGSVAFLDYDAVQRKAELRKLIGDVRQRGKGFGREASALWIRYGLEVLNLKKIYLNTLDTNIRNIQLNEELGFTVEGILRNELFIDGVYHDVLRMGLWQD